MAMLVFSVNKVQKMSEKTTDFGFAKVEEDKKSAMVADVFHSVAKNYDIMNDVMSMGLHRLWKKFTFFTSEIKAGDKVLDIAGGTGDMTLGFKKIVGETGEVWHTDINSSMLKIGRNRLIDNGVITPQCLCDAEKLPFPDDYFDAVCVSFGLRNMTHKDIALTEMHRILKPGGVLLVLEFSKVIKPLEKIYDLYSFKLLPFMGKLIAKDEDSYTYLAESIRVHPNQEELKQIMLKAGFAKVNYHNLTFGVTALHKGYKA
jgi:demethylmenaquinone methyltransferase/2-methoxy-6-polyprenyl-1,4-benzoquinol methylase